MASGTSAIGLAEGGSKDALADGELGVLLSPESNLAAALMRALECDKPDSYALAAATRARFGREPFTAGACAVIERLRDAA
jgi:hypothetical protein